MNSYYDPLIKPQAIGRHYFWSNFKISKIDVPADMIECSRIKDLERNKGFNLDFAKGLRNRKDQVLKNCVNSELGRHVLNQAFKDIQEVLLINGKN